MHKIIEQNDAGFRKQPGTKLLNDRTGQVVYTSPQDYETITKLMANLEQFINNDDMMDADPLVKMAIIHHQFESIHPFYDGNGRAGENHQHSLPGAKRFASSTGALPEPIHYPAQSRLLQAFAGGQGERSLGRLDTIYAHRH